MFCTTCGRENPATSSFCNNCGQPLTPGAAPPPPPPTAAVYTPADPNAPNDGKALASLILGILGLTFFSFLAGIPAIILGHMSRSNIKKSLGKLRGDGMALAGLIMGYISLLAIPFILIIAAIAIPNLLRARVAANEASAVGSIRTINGANVTYGEAHQAFATNLRELENADGIDSVLASGQKSGYRFTYQASDTDGDGKADKYIIEAEPISKGASGRSTFCSDESGIIRKEATGDRCTAESPEL